MLSPYEPFGEGSISSVSIAPTTVSAAALTELKKINFLAFEAKNQSYIFFVKPVFISKYDFASLWFFVSWALPARWIIVSISGILSSSSQLKVLCTPSFRGEIISKP